MFRIILIISFFWSFSVVSQQLVFDGKLSDMDNGRSLAGVNVAAYASGSEKFSAKSASNGKYTVRVPFGEKYTIKYTKSGYVTKTMVIDTREINVEDVPPDGRVLPPIDIELFFERKEVDFSFMEKEPVVVWEYDPRKGLDWDRRVFRQMKRKIEDKLEEAEEIKRERERKYRDLVTNADKDFSRGDYNEALENYEKALKIPGKESEDHPVNRITEIDKKLKELAKEKQQALKLEQEYQNLIQSADNLKEQKSYDKAIDRYSEALSKKPNEIYPKEQIEEVKKIQAEKKKQAEYESLVKKADQLFGDKKWETAKAEYKKALNVLPNEIYPKDQLRKIETEQKAEQDREAKQEEYNKLIAGGDKLFNQSEYKNAIEKYQAAIAIDNTEDHPKAQIKKAEKKIAELEEQKKKQKKYDALIKVGDDALQTEKYQAAIDAYDEALGVMDDDYPKRQKKKAEAGLAELQKEKQKEEKIKQLLIEAQQKESNKEYEASLIKYEEVLGIAPSNTDATSGKQRVTKFIKELEDQKAKDKRFNDLVSKADNLYDQEVWEQAKTSYNEAEKIKPNEQHVQKRLKSIAEKLKQLDADKERQEKIKNLLTKASNEMSSKYWEGAISTYDDVLELDKSNKKAIDGKAEAIKEKEKEAELAKQEEKFNKFKKEGDQFYGLEQWNEAKSRYEEALNIKKDNKVQAQIEKINNKLAELSSEKDKEKKYKELITQAKKNEDKEAYEAALSKYKEALEYKPGDANATTKVKEMEQNIKENEKRASKNEAYNKAMERGVKAFDRGDFAQAIEAYDDALEIKPMDAEALKEKADAKSELDRLSKEEEHYQSLLREGKKLKDRGELLDAKARYKQAQKIRPKDAIPQNAIVEIDELLRKREEAEQAKMNQAEIDKKYEKIIKDADRAVQNEAYEKAIDYYKDALKVKPNEQYPKEKINELENKLRELAEQKERENKYNEFIRKADIAFDDKSYEESIGLYQKALGVKRNETYPKSQIDKAKRLITESSKEDKEANYRQHITKGNSAFSNESYQEAISHYENALGVKPNDRFAQDKIDEARQILKQREARDESLEEKKERFNKIVADADNKFDSEKFLDAKETYEEALKLFPTDAHALKRRDECIAAAQDKARSGDNERYQKIIDKADEYFDEENYDKAKSLYERAIDFRSYDRYPKDQLNKIKRILSEPEKEERKLEYLGEEEDISIAEGAALLEKAEQDRKNLKKQRVLKQIHKNEENFERKTKQDEEERLALQNEIVKIRDSRAIRDFDERSDHQKLAQLIDDDWFNISRQRIQENTYESASLLRNNQHLVYMSENYNVIHRGKNEGHLTLFKEIDDMERTFSKNRAAEREQLRNKWSDNNQNLEETAVEFNRIRNEKAEDHDVLTEKINDIERTFSANRTAEREQLKSKWSDNNHNLEETVVEFNRIRSQKTEDHSKITKQIDVIMNDYSALTNSERSAARQKWLGNNDELTRVAEDFRNDVKRAERLRESNVSKVRDIENFEQDRRITSEQENYKKLIDIQDQAVLTELKKAKSVAEKAKVHEMIQEDIRLLEGDHSLQRNKEMQEVRRSALEIDALLLVAQEQYSKTKATSDEGRKRTIEQIGLVQEDHARKVRKINDRNREGIMKNVEKADKINEMRLEQAEKMDKELSKLREKIVHQENDIQRTARLQREEDERNRRETADNIQNSMIASNQLHSEKRKVAKENGYLVDALEGSISAQKQMKDGEEKHRKLNTQKMLDDFLLEEEEYSPVIANTLGDEYPEGVTEESFVRKDKDDLPIAVITRRIVVKDGRGEVYVRRQTRGIITYSKNGQAITEAAWQRETNNAKLARN